PEEWMDSEGTFAKAFPIREITEKIRSGVLEKDLVKLSESFNKGKNFSPFENSGLMINGKFHTVKTLPHYQGTYTTLGDIILDLKDVPKEFLIDKEDITKEKGWNYLKGAKNEGRYNAAKDFHYNYSEGSMVFPD